MNFGDFVNSFKPVLDAFKADRFPTVVLQRIHTKIMDLSPAQMTELCNLVIDNCEHAPKTVKVAEFANIVRARFHSGRYEAKKEIDEFCDFCQDLRVIRAVAVDKTHETLMLCECTAGAKDPSDWKLQAWSRQWGQFYSKERCPLSWFKPAILFTNPDGSIKFERSIEHNRASWLAKIKLAEEFWVQQRKECEGAS